MAELQGKGTKFPFLPRLVVPMGFAADNNLLSRTLFCVVV